MLTISAISKSLGGRELFRDLSLQVNRGDRIGLVGANGAGKTTLFSLILGQTDPDEGRVSLERGTRMGFLPQENAPVGDETVLELATAVSPELLQARQTIRRCESEGLTEDHSYHEALAVYADLDGHALNAKAKRVLAGLAFREQDHNKPAASLSGGWIMRAHLARLLVQEPELLLLDEPTNHLDLESLVWFREYLRGYPGAILMISHDRDFLNELVLGIAEISRSRLHRYHGNYDEYLVEKAAREAQYAAAYENQQREIAHIQQFIDRFRAKASKAAQAQSRMKQLDKMEKLEAPAAAEAKVNFRFPQPARSGQKVISLKNVDHAYGQHVVYRGLNFEAERGQRIVLVGPNGAGKSTLLKLLAGVLPVQTGELTIGHNVTPGYFAQHRMEQLGSGRTVLEAARDLPSPPTEQLTRTILGAFLFKGDDVFKSVSVLSGGEKSRLSLARTLLCPPNLLLMDEPTTHLDIPSIDALINALEQYEGTVIFISHDIHFIRAVAKQVLHISAGTLTPYAGDYDYYLEKSQAGSAREALVAGAAPSNFQPVQQEAATGETARMGLKEIKALRKAEAEKRKAAAKAKRDAEAELANIEKSIIELETRQRELTAALEKDGSDASLVQALSQTSTLLANANSRWERTAETASKLQEEAGDE